MIESFTFPYIARAPFPSKVTVFENNSHLSFTASRIAPCEECFPGIRGFDKQWRIKKNILYITKRGKKTRQPQTLTGLCVRICGANQLTLVKWGGGKVPVNTGLTSHAIHKFTPPRAASSGTYSMEQAGSKGSAMFILVRSSSMLIVFARFLDSGKRVSIIFLEDVISLARIISKITIFCQYSFTKIQGYSVLRFLSDLSEQSRAGRN